MRKSRTNERTKKIKAVCIRTFLTIQMAILYALPVLASDTTKKDEKKSGLIQSKLVQGTIALLTDARLALCLVEAGFLTFLEIKEGMAYQAAEEQEKAMHKKKMISMLAMGVLIVCATALIPTILGYYQE